MTQPNFPPLPPPLGYPPPPAVQPIFLPAPRGGGFVRAIFTTLAVTLFGLSLTLNVWLLVYFVMSGSDGIDRSVLTEGDTNNTIAVLPLDGEISQESVEGFTKLLRTVADDPNVKGVVIEVNTPGGSVGGSERIHAAISKLRKDRGVPVVVAMGDLATSGGYYIACAADHVVAGRTTWTGNIGVLLPRISLARMAEKYGVEDRTIISTGSDFKDAGSMFKDDTPEETAYWTDLADQAFAVFKDVIVKGRKLPQADVDKLANGKVYTGPEALALKLIDAIGDTDAAVAAAAAKSGVTKPHVVRMSFKPSLFGDLGAFGSASQTRSLVEAEIGGARISVDAATASRLFSRRPMYLFDGR